MAGVRRGARVVLEISTIRENAKNRSDLEISNLHQSNRGKIRAPVVFYALVVLLATSGQSEG